MAFRTVSHPGELRAFEMIERPDPRHLLHLVPDTYHSPHLRAGETAVIDPTDTALAHGEVFMIEWRPGVRRLYQVRVRPFDGPNGPAKGLWFGPLNRPPFRADGSVDLSGPLHLSDGPMRLEHWPDVVAGRVVGILADGGQP